MADNSAPNVHLILLAGGLGIRARHSDSAAPKQFRTVGGHMLFMWSVLELLKVAEITTLTVAVPEAWDTLAKKSLAASPLDRPWFLARAGDTRAASTWQAIRKLTAAHGPGAEDLVAVHDAARPFASRHLLRRLIGATLAHGAAVPGIDVTDTIVRIAEGQPGQEEANAQYLERAALQAVQTPQVFRWQPFFEAHRGCHQERAAFTDDGGLLAARGLQPVVVMGERENWKVTTEADWERAELALKTLAAKRGLQK